MTVNDAVDASPSGGDGLIWAVLSYRSGENTQILGLAREFQARSGWHLEIKRLDYRAAGIYNLTRRTGLRGVRLSRSSSLEAPWPDLVISAGLRNEPPCRWIREQSSGKTRVVFLGRSWVSPDKLDLLVTTPQYRVPEHPRVLQNRLTLHGVDDALLQSAASRWQTALEAYPRPRAGVLLGGSVGPYVVGDVAVDRIAEFLNGGKFSSALISSSSRTEPGLATRLANQIDLPAFVYEWRPEDEANPYAGLLALSDELIVSGDSIAMLSEAAATGKRVHIVDLGAGAWSMGSRAGRESRREDVDFNAWFYRGLMRYGHRRWTRDISRVHDQLIANGQANWLGEAGVEPDRREPRDDMDAAICAIRALWPAQDPAAFADSADSSTKRPSTTRYTRSETSASAD